MAMRAHQVDEEMVTAREGGEQRTFAVKESLAAVGGHNGVPAEISPALTAVLANLSGTLIQLQEQVDDVKVQMKEQGDDLKDQLNQAKEQGNNVIKRLDNNSKIMVKSPQHHQRGAHQGQQGPV
jgi:hypothetical protein